MNSSPRTLVQIHYHYRHGGVRVVIDRYSELFTTVDKGQRSSIVVCSSRGARVAPSHLTMLDIPDLDYHSFDSVENFNTVRTQLISKFSKLFSSSGIEQPIAVLFHNVSLGKNCAASSAFAHCASVFGGDQIRFFAILHDFAEEGRGAMIDEINKISEWGVPIRQDLFLVNSRVHFVVPGYLSYEILSSLDFPVTLLPNPLNAHQPELENGSVIEKLVDRAYVEGVSFNKKLPFFYYPSRIIHRKNVIEAIALSLIYDVNLILGAKGQSPRDLELLESIKSIVQKYNLKILVDPARFDFLNDNNGNPTPVLYTICDYTISTSVTEGFGYSLYEPWIYNKPLIARWPKGFRYHADLGCECFYTCLPVPTEWVDTELLVYEYKTRFGEQNDVIQKIRELCESETIDFADLDVRSQTRIIERILNDQNELVKWNTLLRVSEGGWPGLEQIRNRAVKNIEFFNVQLSSFFNFKKDVERFSDLMNVLPQFPVSKYRYEELHGEFFKRGFSIHLQY